MDEPKLHLWGTGIMRITRHPQARSMLCIPALQLTAPQLTARLWLDSHTGLRLDPPTRFDPLLQAWGQLM